MLAVLLVGFAVFAGVYYFMEDVNFKKLSFFGAAICLIIFVVLLLLYVAGVSTPVPLWVR
jgi:hypothetical protein